MRASPYAPPSQVLKKEALYLQRELTQRRVQRSLVAARFRAYMGSGRHRRISEILCRNIAAGTSHTFYLYFALDELRAGNENEALKTLTSAKQMFPNLLEIDALLAAFRLNKNSYPEEFDEVLSYASKQKDPRVAIPIYTQALKVIPQQYCRVPDAREALHIANISYYSTDADEPLCFLPPLCC